jgi:hypothetical protein
MGVSDQIATQGCRGKSGDRGQTGSRSDVRRKTASAAQSLQQGLRPGLAGGTVEPDGSIDTLRGQVQADHLGLRPAHTQPPHAIAQTATDIEDPRRGQPDQVEPLDHAPFDFAKEKVGLPWRLAAPVELTADGQTV